MLDILKEILNLTQPIQIYFSKNQNFDPNFFLHFWNLDQILNSLKWKITLITHVFLKLQTAKVVVRKMFKRSRFRRPFNKRHGKWSETLLKSDGQHLYHIYWSLWRELSRKKSLLVMCKILGMFVTTLTTDDKH